MKSSARSLLAGRVLKQNPSSCACRCDLFITGKTAQGTGGAPRASACPTPCALGRRDLGLRRVSREHICIRWTSLQLCVCWANPSGVWSFLAMLIRTVLTPAPAPARWLCSCSFHLTSTTPMSILHLTLLGSSGGLDHFVEGVEERDSLI